MERRTLVPRIAGTAIFAAAAVGAVLHAVLVRHYPHMTIPGTVVLDVVDAVVWAASAAVVATRWRDGAAIPVLGALLAVSHGVTWSVVQPPAGLGLVIAAPIALMATWRALSMAHRAEHDPLPAE